jgi:hypothetical protein
MAYLQALSCNITQTNFSRFSVIVDKETAEQVTDKHRSVFDNIIVLKNDMAASSKIKMHNECQVFALSPYKQTIKTEADMLFTGDCAVTWWNKAHKIMDFTQLVYTYDHKEITNRSQRRIFDDTFLPNIYSAWTYFTYDLRTKQFYDTVRAIIDDWDWYRDHYLVNCRYETPRTDEVYAIAVQILYLPLSTSMDGFVHMKNDLQDISRQYPWTQTVPFELHSDMIPTIGHYKQRMPLHYVEKTFVTDELLDRYEYEYANRRRNQGMVG